MTTGEAHALIAMITGQPAEEFVAFVIVTVTEASGCQCGHPENHRGQKVTDSIDDDLLAAGVLSRAMHDLITREARARYGEGS